GGNRVPAPIRGRDLADWLYRPAWKQSLAPGNLVVDGAPAPQPLGWLLFLDSGGLGAELAARLRQGGAPVVTAVGRDTFWRLATDAYTVDCADREAHRALFTTAEAVLGSVDRVVCFWPVEDDGSAGGRTLFFSLLALAQGIGDWLLGRGSTADGGAP